MKNSAVQSYSQLYNLRWGLEYELNNVVNFYSGEDRIVVERYFKKRIVEIKEEEKECLKVQTS
jgi:hypothetical protein